MIETREKVERTLQEFPLPVASDYDALVEKAEEVAEIVDRHLDYEEQLQRIEMSPTRLCPGQRLNLAFDLQASR